MSKKSQEFKMKLQQNKGKQIPVEEKMFITVNVKDIVASVDVGKIKVNAKEIKEIVSDIISIGRYAAGEVIDLGVYCDCFNRLLVQEKNLFKVI